MLMKLKVVQEQGRLCLKIKSLMSGREAAILKTAADAEIAAAEAATTAEDRVVRASQSQSEYTFC